MPSPCDKSVLSILTITAAEIGKEMRQNSGQALIALCLSAVSRSIRIAVHLLKGFAVASLSLAILTGFRADRERMT